MKRMSLKLIILLLVTSATTLHAQNGMRSFEHLSVGVEAGTTGIGLELATPLNSFMVLRGGVSMFPFTYSTDFDVDVDVNKIDGLIEANPAIQEYLSNNNLPTSASQLNRNVDIDAKLGLLNGKLLVDFYPFKSSSFHLIAGLYMGKDKIVKLSGELDPTTNRVIKELNKFDPTINTSVEFEDYRIQTDANGNVDAAIKIKSLKPYLGLGFGNAIPKKRVAFQFELGAMFHGTPEVTSDSGTVIKDSSVESNASGLTKILNKVTVYPVMSFRLTGRIL